MEEQHNSIDEMFRQSLSDYREAPPAAAWGEITRRLDEDERRPRAFFMRWPWLAMLLLLIAGGTWFTIAMHNSINSRNSRHLAKKGRQSQRVSTQQSSKGESIPATTGKLGDKSAVNTTVAMTDAQPTIPNALPVTAKSASDKPFIARKDAATMQRPASLAGIEHHTARPGADLPSIGNQKAAVITQTHKPLPSKVTEAATASQPSVKHRESTDLATLSTTAGKVQVSAAGGGAQSTVGGSREKSGTDSKNGGPAHKMALAATVNAPNKALPIGMDKLKKEPKAPQSNKGAEPNVTKDAATSKELVLRSNARKADEPASTSPLENSAVAIKENPTTKGPQIIVVPGRAVRGALISESLRLIPASGLASKSTAPDRADKPVERKTEPDIASQAPSSLADTTATVLSTKRKPMLSFAAMAGYETGLTKPTSNRIAVTGRLQYHINKAFGIGIQPSFRFGAVSSPLSDTRAYQRISTYDTTFISFTTSPSVIPSTDTLYNFRIQENFDSIVVQGSSIKGSFWQIELPLILSYRIASAWTIYGGPSLNFGGRLPGASSGETKTYTTIRRDTLIQSQPVSPSMSINYFGTKSSLEPYSAYKPAVVQDAASMRLGYLVGVCYERRKLLLDASLHQQVSGYSNVNQQLQKIYSGPYLRLSIGYNLVPQRHVPKKTID